MGDFEKRPYSVLRIDEGPGGVRYSAVPEGPHSPPEAQEVYAFSPEEAVVIVSRGEAQPTPAEVRTPREALLAIRGVLREIHSESDPYEIAAISERFINDGLLPTRVDTYEFTDHVVQRLAKALLLLQQLREGSTDMATISGEIDEVLALPPDIEASVDRFGFR